MVLTIPNPSRILRFRHASALACLLLCAGSALAQKYEPPPPPLLPGPCIPTKKEPCDPPPHTTPPAAAADKNNPFPGEPSSVPPSNAGGQNAFPGEPEASRPASPNNANGNAFPGEPENTKSAPNAASQNPFPGESDSSSSSSSSSAGTTTGADSIPDPDANAPLTRTQRRHLPKVEDMGHREAEDLDISHYYITTGNFKAAYLRAKDAVATIPDDPDAHFALATAADRMKSSDEAVSEYSTYLKMDPEGIHAKAATKALAALASPGK